MREIDYFYNEFLSCRKKMRIALVLAIASIAVCTVLVALGICNCLLYIAVISQLGCFSALYENMSRCHRNAVRLVSNAGEMHYDVLRIQLDMVCPSLACSARRYEAYRRRWHLMHWTTLVNKHCI